MQIRNRLVIAARSDWFRVGATARRGCVATGAVLAAVFLCLSHTAFAADDEPAVLSGTAEWAEGHAIQPTAEAAAEATEIDTSDVGVVVIQDEPELEIEFDPYAPEGGYRSNLEREWFQGGEHPIARAVETREHALEIGERNVESVARALIATRPDQAEGADLGVVVRLAPDLPIAHMALAKARWSEGSHFEAIAAAFAGVRAIPRHLEASLWLLSTLLVLIAAVLIIGPVLFGIVVGCSVFRHAAHDLGDVISGLMPGFARTALLGALLLVPIVLGEGLIGFLLVMLALGFIYGSSRHRMALLLGGVLLLLGLYPVGRVASTVLNSLESDPIAVAALSVMRGVESSLDVELLESNRGSDPLARYALAQRAGRRGESKQMRKHYEQLLSQEPADPVLLTNLGNLHFRNGRTEKAIDFYERAAQLSDSPIVLFDLAQAYARGFRMDEYESVMARAQKRGGEVVAEMSRGGDSSFVADLPHPIGPIRSQLLARSSDGDAMLTRSAVDLIAPGYLGTSWMTLTGGLVLTALLSILVSGRFDHASCCNRCGRRICGRCDGSVWSSQTCEGCYRLFNRPETTDASLRMKRLKSLRAREQRMGKLATLASLIVPGASGLLAKRPDLCFVGILLFVWAAASLVWRDGIVPDPLAVGGAGSLALVITACVALLAYFAVTVTGLIMRRSL